MTMTEETMAEIDRVTTELADLFARFSRAPEGATDFQRGQADAFERAAHACNKAGTRKMIVWPEVAIKFTVPGDA